MKDITNYIQKATKDIKMTDAERGQVFSVIQEYQRMKPIRTPGLKDRGIPFFNFFAQPVALALVLMIFTTSGISYAAEGALPGELLYPVKTKVTEPLRVAIASSPEERATVEIALAERRISEASELAASDALDTDTQEQLAVAFEAHVERASVHIEEVDAEDASASVALTSQFETRLAAREGVLDRVHDQKPESSTRLSDAIRSAGMNVASIRTRSEERLAVSSVPAPDSMAVSMAFKAAPAPESASAASNESSLQIASATSDLPAQDMNAARRMRDMAVRQLKNAQKSLKSASLSKDAEVQATAELEYAAQKLEEGKTHIEASEAAFAFHAFQQSLITSEKIDVVAKSYATLKKAKSRGTRSEQDERQDRADARNFGDSARGQSFDSASASLSTSNDLVQTLSLPSTIQMATTVADKVPAISPIPQSVEIYNPVQDTIKGLIKGASTSREYSEDEDDDKKNRDKDENKNEGRKGED